MLLLFSFGIPYPKYIIVIQATVDKCNDLLGVMEVEGATSGPSPTVSVAIPMLSMRFFANSFKGSGSSSAIVSNLDRYVKNTQVNFSI
jgi:hypothetical protein